MNPVNATALYVSASRSVLQCDPRDPRALAELCRLLPFFRQSLSCLVCGNVLQDPIAPTNSSCQHYVCRGCKGRRMQLKPSCSWCKDYSCFQENRQLSLLVHCYRKLCLYITQSPLAPHIAGAAHDSPDLQAILSEGLTMADGVPEMDDTSDPMSPEEASPTTELKEEEPSPMGVNGLHGCNGSVSSDSLHPVAMETGGGVVKQEEVPVCVSVTAHREAGLCDISLKHGGGGALLLSVEEVLRTLESDPDCLNGRHSPMRPDSPRPSTLENKPCPLQPRPPPRCRRKRSHSESDSEKLQPLPISSLLPAPPCSLSARVTPKLEPRYPHATPPHPHPHPHLAPLPNGGPSKARPLLVPNKALKKTSDHHGAAKKAFPKARQGAAKPRPQPRDRLPTHTHPLTHPPSPSKPLHKKPVEKKGCKCGRATQNPSVLTCRGQRCPCYSNRKACLDCICRGCQNSYMANGEKKLEAFAVPEKALEQTRLTLGINLTSIAAAALRNPATSVSVTTATGGPVTASAFLSGAGHDGRGFDDSLEVRFDC